LARGVAEKKLSTGTHVQTPVINSFFNGCFSVREQRVAVSNWQLCAKKRRFVRLLIDIWCCPFLEGKADIILGKADIAKCPLMTQSGHIGGKFPLFFVAHCFRGR